MNHLCEEVEVRRDLFGSDGRGFGQELLVPLRGRQRGVPTCKGNMRHRLTERCCAHLLQGLRQLWTKRHQRHQRRQQGQRRQLAHPRFPKRQMTRLGHQQQVPRPFRNERSAPHPSLFRRKTMKQDVDADRSLLTLSDLSQRRGRAGTGTTSASQPASSTRGGSCHQCRSAQRYMYRQQVSVPNAAGLAACAFSRIWSTSLKNRCESDKLRKRKISPCTDIE